MNADEYVIVGASLAGAKAAETLREEGFAGPVVLIGEESERPYERPPLSKDYLLGKAGRDTIYVHPPAWYAEHGVDLRLGVPVTGIDAVAHEVTLEDGSRVGYAKLLLTTGSSPQTAAKAMLGQDAAYDLVPYFYTDQYDLSMEYAGWIESGRYDQVIFRGDVQRREFIAFWLAGGRVLAGMNVNIFGVNDAIQAIVRAGHPVDTGRLANPDVPLEEFFSG
jgi:pyridine nucleotide-disulfide oxidoreductase/NAD/ferredoxin-dependent reductase-like protein